MQFSSSYAVVSKLIVIAVLSFGLSLTMTSSTRAQGYRSIETKRKNIASAQRSQIGAAAQASESADGEPVPPSAKEIRGPSPYVEIKNEPAPRLFVDPPLQEGLAIGVVWIQYRVENLRIVPIFGEAAAKVTPRVGHIHVTVDDLPFWWADASDDNTIDIAGLPAGQHKVRIELVTADHKIVPGQTKIVTFNLPVSLPHGH